MNNSYITIIKEKRTALSRKRIPLNQNGCTANFRIGVPFEQNLHKNNNSPRLTVSARIVAKRQNTTHNNQPNAGDISGAHGFHTISSTSYYVTFQVDSGDRMELSVSGSEYGVLAEGDKGQLTFQGTRYLTFDREN